MKLKIDQTALIWAVSGGHAISNGKTYVNKLSEVLNVTFLQKS
jgi:hypothetical protein